MFGDNTDIFCRNKTQSRNLLTLNQINIAAMNCHRNDVFRDKRDIFCRNETQIINLLTLQIILRKDMKEVICKNVIMTSLQFDDVEMMYLLTEESDKSCRKETEITNILRLKHNYRRNPDKRQTNLTAMR